MMIASVTLVELSCGVCSLPFAVPQTFDKRGREKGGEVWCPAGHKMHYGESENERLRREAARLTSSLDQERARSKTLERSRAAVQGQLTKAKKRAANGVCQCCHRSFIDVARHMRSKHPEFVEEAHGQ